MKNNEISAKDVYLQVWKAINQVNLDSLVNGDCYYPQEINQSKAKLYFQQTSEYRLVNLALTDEENEKIIRAAGFSVEYLKQNFTKLATKAGSAEQQFSSVERQLSMVSEGYIYAICPSTGRVISSNRSLFFNTRWYFYRFVSKQVFYVATDFSAYYLYFPEIDSIVHMARGSLNLIQSIISTWKAEMVANWKRVSSYLCNTTEVKTVAIVGLQPTSTAHHIWNDLSGIQRIGQEEGVLEKIEKFIVPLGSEFYGGIHEIFSEIPPEKVQRVRSSEIKKIIEENNYFCLRLRDQWVTSLLAERIYELSKVRCKLSFLSKVREVKKKYFPLLWISFRTGKRTWLSQTEGIANITNKLIEDYPNLAIIFDGYSQVVVDGNLVVKPNERENISKERKALSEIKSRMSPDIPVYDIIGHPMYEVLVWADAVDLYVAPWGGGLAKIVSIANKPGVVHTNKSGSKGSALDYSRSRENRAECVLIPEHHIVDAPEDKFAQTNPIHGSYDCDWKIIYEEVFKLASSLKRD